MFQPSLFPPPSEWKPPRLDDLPQDWNAVSRIGLDTETKDTDLKRLGCGVRRGGELMGISLCLDGQEPLYLPMRHLGGDNCPEGPEAVLRYVRDQAKRFRGDVVGAKISYDLDYLEEEGVVFPQARFRDVQVAEALIDELQLSYSLDSILKRRGLSLKDETLLREAAASFRGAKGKLDPKRDLWMLPGRFVGPYAEADALRPLELLRSQEIDIERNGLQRIWDLETDVLPVLVKMRRRGVRVNMDKLDQVERYAQAEETKVWSEVLRLSGVHVRVGDAMKAAVLARVFQAVGVSYQMTSQGKPSITKEFLAHINHPVGDLIRRARKMSQLRSTFVNSIRQHVINHGDEWRVHCTFNQTVVQDDDDEVEGARPGRLSCVDPNLQQQPSPDRDPEIGGMWRDIYEPDRGALWGTLDYSQQEPRLAVHTAVISGPERIGKLAHDSALLMAQRYWDDRSADAHTLFTQTVYGEDVVNEPKDVFKKKRNYCKQIFLGIAYGMGGAKLCRQLGLPLEWKYLDWAKEERECAGAEGQAILDLVDQRAPYLKTTARAVESVAKQRGYVITILGRHCHFPKSNGKYDWTYKAFNRAIQGGAADQTKRAMVELDRAGAYLQLQIHDEFDESIESQAVGEAHAKIMEDCVPLKVPSKVDLEIGPSWGRAK
jgi:DNA polymerase I-like protein with 3'-5' exonuclease and polymerase domains